MKTKSLLTAILLLCINTVFAAPLFNVEKILTQPDGTKLYCYASGDEFYNRLHDADGFTIVQAENGYFVYATTDANGKVIPTQHIAGRSNPKALGLTPNIMISQEDYQKKREAMRVPETRDSKNLNHGVYNNLVVFIKFKGDNDLSTTTTKLNEMFNNDGYYDISMNNYYKKATYNQLSMASYYYPMPEGDKVLAYEDIYPRNYYQPYNEVTNPEGYIDQAEREFPLLKRAIEYVADMVPDTLNIDRNNDGEIDNVIFVVKGNVGDWSDLLWPHMWSMYGEDAYINGKKVGTFNFQLETSTYFTVSTLCHEMGHSLGLPDLYHYLPGFDNLSPAGPWDLMCGNASPPQHTATYMKYKYGTWIDEIPEIGYGTYTIEANSWEGGRRNCYKIATSHPDQYYLVEYRNRNNFFESGLPGSGLLIYRIDTRYHGCNNFDGNTYFDEVYIFRPGGAHNRNGNINQAAFSAEQEKTEFNINTDPYPFLNKNQEDLTFNICNISETGNQMTFTYCPLDTEIIPKNLRISVNGFKNVVKLNWDVVETAESYNVYRNNKLIANVKENSFNDSYEDNSSEYYNYHVTSVFANEESYKSNIKNVVTGDFSEYVINLESIGEYGWQGGEIKVSFDNENMEDKYFTIYSGNEQTRNFIVPIGTKVNISWLKGWDDKECSFTITNNDETIYTSSDLQEGLLMEFTANNVSTCSAPNNLTSTVAGNSIVLEWETTVDVESFAVLRNNEVIAENIKDYTYIDKNIPETASYEYCVKSMDSDCMSLPSNIVTENFIKYKSGEISVETSLENNNVELNWNLAIADNNVLGYDDGVYVGSEGSNNHRWGIKIESEKLKLYEGSEIYAIEIYDASSAHYQFSIHNGDNVHDSTMLYEEEFVTNNTGGFVELTLSEKVSFDNSKDLWLVAKTSMSDGKPIPGGEYVGEPNSCLIRTGNNVWSPATTFGLNYSWLLRIKTEGSFNDEKTTYNILRDNELIATNLSSKSFTDQNIEDKNCYKVEAFYDNCFVVASEEICVDPAYGNGNSKIFPIPTNDYLNIKYDNILNVKLFNITGAIVFDQDVSGDAYKIDMRRFVSGVYIVEIVTAEEIITEKVIYVK